MILEYLKETKHWNASLMQFDETDKYIIMYDNTLSTCFEYTKPLDYTERKTGLLIPENLL